jgi:DNA polymerase III delta prime subunit
MEKGKELKLLKELEELKHKDRMEQIEVEARLHKEVENLKFDHMIQLQRIKSAEIRKTIDRRGDREFMEGYAKK